ncbi:MAG: class I SAM-dependent methyltransferase [Acholeplasmataceae bacterium]|nr:class I SAM-dependent methyltransferase [Acholeplasmataceae bacterium]
MSDHQILDIAHLQMKNYITKDDVVIDMTMGNGFDTLYLAGLSKFVYAFDIQETALEHTHKKLFDNQLSNYKLILDSHENILSYVKKFKYVVYNLGYLPNGDKHITTKKESTLSSLKTVLTHVDEKGMVFMMIYPAHEAGKIESLSIEQYLESIDHEQFKVIKTYLPFQEHMPPYLITIYKKGA